MAEVNVAVDEAVLVDPGPKSNGSQPRTAPKWLHDWLLIHRDDPVCVSVPVKSGVTSGRSEELYALPERTKPMTSQATTGRHDATHNRKEPDPRRITAVLAIVALAIIAGVFATTATRPDCSSLADQTFWAVVAVFGAACGVFSLAIRDRQNKRL